MPPSQDLAAQEHRDYSGNSYGFNLADEAENVNPSVRYSINQAHLKLQKINDLLSRHLNLTGDESIVFNQWRNDMERKAAGYYDPRTDTINLNDLTEDTLNHEIAHKVLQRSQKSPQLIAEVRQRVGDDALVNRYSDEYGTTNLDLLAEEYIADGFAEYYNGKLLGESDQRLASRLGIPPRLVAIYDRIAQALRSLIGKRDDILAFYAQIETGKYRSLPRVDEGDVRVRAMSLDAKKALETIKKFDDVLRGIRRVTKLDTIGDDAAARITQTTGVDVSGGASIELTNQNAIHIHNRHIKNPDDPRPLSDYDIAALPEVIKDPDTITKEKVVRGVQRIKFEREIEGNKKAVVEVIKKGNTLNVVTYFNDSSSGRPNVAEATSGYTSETGQLQSTNPSYSIPNNPRLVNNKRFKLNNETQPTPPIKHSTSAKDLPPTKKRELARRIAAHRIAQGEMHYIADVVKDVANRAGITEKKASRIVKNEAEIANVDISNERAKKRRVTQDTPSIADENGEHVPLDQMVVGEAVFGWAVLLLFTVVLSYN